MSLSPLEGEAHIGNVTMQTAASNNLVFTNVSSLKLLAEFEKRVSDGGLYQAIAQTLITRVHINQTLAGLATRLAAVADHAYDTRRLDVVGRVGQLLLSLPLSRQLERVGNYYQALSLNVGGCGDVARASSLFEQAADKAPLRYRARAILALGATSLAAGDDQTAMSFYREVMRIVAHDNVLDSATFYFTCRNTAVIRSMEGDHQGSIS